jgi:hypothetical protein
LITVTKCVCGGCPCHEVDAMKDPKIKAEFRFDHEAFNDKYPSAVDPEGRFVQCNTCGKTMVKNETGQCTDCYWSKQFEVGIPVEPQKWI